MFVFRPTFTNFQTPALQSAECARRESCTTPTMGFASSPPVNVARAHGKAKCKYGNACYRVCPHHWRDFDHDDSHPFLQPPALSPPPADAETDEETDEDEPAQVMSPLLPGSGLWGLSQPVCLPFLAQ